MLSRFLRFRPDGGTTGGAPSAAAPAAAAVPINNGEGDAPTERIVPQEEGTPASIRDASKSFRERLERVAAEADAAGAPAAPAAGEPAKPKPAQGPDGKFVPTTPEGIAAAEAAAAAGDPAAPADPLASETPIEEGEPTLFVLKGEASRGEEDIELDVTGLPPEVIERLQRSEKQGMRRAEYDGAMQKVRTERSDLDAVETEIRVDPAGFVLNRVAPATRMELAETLLLDQWEHLAPMIELLWTDDSARSKKIGDIKNAITNRQSSVVATITASRQAAEVRSAVSAMVPDNVTDEDAREFFATSIALLQTRVLNNEPVTPKDVPALLAAHRRRFFGAGEPAASSTPPARPKLAVRQPPSAPTKPAAPATPPKPVVSQEEIARRAKARTGALAAAPQGAGAGAVQRPRGPANETIEQASKRLRAQRTG